VAVFPSDDAYTPLWRSLAAQRPTLTFSDVDPAADVRALSVAWQGDAWTLTLATPAGQHTCRLRIAGRHNVRNALAATASALAAGVSLGAIARGLNGFEPVGGRSRALSLNLGARNITLIDDSYNANPDSVVAAIDVLAELPGPRLLVLGDMGEVGDDGLAFHLEVLRHAHAKGIEDVQCAGDWMRQACEALQTAGGAVPAHWANVDAMASHVKSRVAGDGGTVVRSVLVKGSRFMRMERVVQALMSLDQKTSPQEHKDASHAA
jgi:UDP-N-acetylmuramoyl-tripeptide--D-alanyl-D-alanine ligase